jgi:hypothetical protein
VKYFEERLCQRIKTGYIVCGDTASCERTPLGTWHVLCDGIGSGVYANIAATMCASRIMELIRLSMPIRAACETVAASMHSARSEDIPFSAFLAMLIMPNGQFVVYNYEAPQPLLIKGGKAIILKPRFYTAGYEVIGESTGMLSIGDAVILCSDGITQAGLGHGYAFGIGVSGLADYINKTSIPICEIPDRAIEMCASLSDGVYEDDMSISLITCREGKQLTLLTGPPFKQSQDRKCVMEFMDEPGKKIICGSTTADIVCRELGKTATLTKLPSLFGSLPEYTIDGIDLATEGALMLNQVCNILGEPPESFVEDTSVERFCRMLSEADIIKLIIGTAVNDAHETLLFKQVGVRVRKAALKLLTSKLIEMGKLVIEKHY